MTDNTIFGNNEELNRNQFGFNNGMEIMNRNRPLDSQNNIGNYSLFSDSFSSSLVDNSNSSSCFSKTISPPPGIDNNSRIFCQGNLISSPSSYGSNTSFESHSDFEINRLTKENEDLKIKNKQAIDIINMVNKTVINSGYGNIGNLIESANKFRDTCYRYDSERLRLIGIIEEEKSKNYNLIKEKDLIIEKLKSEITSNENYISEQDDEINKIKKHIDLLHHDYQSKINGISINFDRKLKVEDDSFFESDNNSKDLSEIKSDAGSDNNSVKNVSKNDWYLYSDNICIYFSGNDKNYQSVRNKVQLLFKKASIDSNDFSDKNHIVVPKSKINNEKYRDMAYIKCGNHLFAISVLNRLIESKSSDVKVYFSKPTSEFRNSFIKK